MAINCGDVQRLVTHIQNSYPSAKMTEPDAIGTKKFTFTDGLIVNVFNNGTVNFQGKPSGIRKEIEAQIDIINRV